MTTAAERAVERLERRLFGQDGNGSSGAIGEISRRLRHLEEWATAQRAVADNRQRTDERGQTGVEILGRRLALESDNVRWGILFAIAGSPLLLRLLGLG